MRISRKWRVASAECEFFIITRVGNWVQYKGKKFPESVWRWEPIFEEAN